MILVFITLRPEHFYYDLFQFQLTVLFSATDHGLGGKIWSDCSDDWMSPQCPIIPESSLSLLVFLLGIRETENMVITWKLKCKRLTPEQTYHKHEQTQVAIYLFAMTTATNTNNKVTEMLIALYIILYLYYPFDQTNA